MGNSTLPFFISFYFFAEYFYTSLYVFFLLHVLAASSFVGTKHRSNKKTKIELEIHTEKKVAFSLVIILLLVPFQSIKDSKNKGQGLIRKYRKKIFNVNVKIFVRESKSPLHINLISIHK